MPVPNFGDLITPTSSANGLFPETKNERILTLLAMLASGTAPDGTSLPAAGAPAGATFTWNLDVNYQAVWPDAPVSLSLSYPGPTQSAAVTSLPVVLAAGGFFTSSCSFASGTPATAAAQLYNSYLSVSNTAGTQTFIASYNTPTPVVGTPLVTPTWTKFGGTGTDLHLDATNTQVVSTAGGVFVAQLLAVAFRSA